MRAWTSCSALLLAILLPAAASAQPVARNGGFYGNTYVAPDYDYPYARTEDGYAEGYPLVTRPASRAYQGQRVAGYPYDVSTTGSVATLPQDYGTGYDNSIDYAISPEFQRQIVAYRGTERPGTIVVDTSNKFLYLVQDGGRAIRYGIGVGREGFEWSGAPDRIHEARMAVLASAGRDDPPPSRPSPVHGRRPGQSARRPRSLSRLLALPHPRHQRAAHHRTGRLLRLHPHAQR